MEKSITETIGELKTMVYDYNNFKHLKKGYRGFTSREICKMLGKKKFTDESYYPDMYGLLDWIDAYYDIHKYYLKTKGTYYPQPLWRDEHFSPIFMKARATLAALLAKNEAKEQKPLHTSKGGL